MNLRGVDPARGLGSAEAGQCLLRNVTYHVTLDKSFIISEVGVAPGIAVGMTELIARVQCSEQCVLAPHRHTTFVTSTTPTSCPAPFTYRRDSLELEGGFDITLQASLFFFCDVVCGICSRRETSVDRSL